MRRRAASLLVIALAVVVAPGATAAEKERTGTRINLFAGDVQVFPANQAFHVSHGWILSPHDSPPLALGKYDFSLAVDGVELQADFVDKFHFEDSELGTLQNRTWVFNFPEGMTGTHTFTGHWSGPCAGLVAAGLVPGPCEQPTERTTWRESTITVVFVP